MSKQYAFQGIHLIHGLNVKNFLATSASLSPSGAATLTYGAVPNKLIKEIVKGTKWLVAIPIGIPESVPNGIFGRIEKFLFKNQLLINMTSVWRLTDGPELRKIPRLKNRLSAFLKYLRNKLGNGK